METDSLAPRDELASYLDSFTNETYRKRVGPLGMLGLLEPTRVALRAYTEQIVREARKAGHSWQEIGQALRVPRQTAHRRYSRVDPEPESDE